MTLLQYERGMNDRENGSRWPRVWSGLVWFGLPEFNYQVRAWYSGARAQDVALVAPALALISPTDLQTPPPFPDIPELLSCEDSLSAEDGRPMAVLVEYPADSQHL